MLEESIAFSKIPAVQQNRFEDRTSFLYLEHMKIVQTSHGVTGYYARGSELVEQRVQLPVGGLALLALGPGTSISSAAMISCARSGCVVQFTGGGGYPEHTTMVPLATSAKWAVAQAAVVSDPVKAKKAAKTLYLEQFGTELTGSIAQMRGIEGTLMRKAYNRNAQLQGVKNFRRNSNGDDAVNVALNVMNGLLYGISASACHALGLSTSLGIIHRGHANSFLFDMADIWKPRITIPLAFSLAKEEPENVPALASRALRQQFSKEKYLGKLINILGDLFADEFPLKDEDSLIGGVPAHKNYSTARSESLASSLLEHEEHGYSESYEVS